MKEKTKKVFLSIAIAFCAVFATVGIVLTTPSITAVANVEVPTTRAYVNDFTEPEIGALPDMEMTAGHGVYSVTEVLWLYKTGNYFSDWNTKKPFAPGNTYRVGIVVTAGDSWNFDVGYIDAQLNGETVEYKQIDRKTVELK